MKTKIHVFINALSILLAVGIIYDMKQEIKTLKQKTERNFSKAQLALFGTYCNNYRNRALEHFVRHENWDGYVLFSPPCNVQYSLERLDSVKFRKEVPEHYDMVINYDSFFTGKGYGGENTDKMLNEYDDKIVKEYKDYVKNVLGVTQSLEESRK